METTKTGAAPGTEAGAAQGKASKIDLIEAAAAIQQAFTAAIDRLDKAGSRRDEGFKIEAMLALLALLPIRTKCFGASGNAPIIHTN